MRFPWGDRVHPLIPGICCLATSRGQVRKHWWCMTSSVNQSLSFLLFVLRLYEKIIKILYVYELSGGWIFYLCRQSQIIGSPLFPILVLS